MKVTQICIGRFHHFHLARQLEKHNLLDNIYTGYPKFKLRDEEGIPKGKIKNFPWFHTPYMFLLNKGIRKSSWLTEELSWIAHDSLDKHVASSLKNPGVTVSLSSTGLHAGRKTQALGGKYICDRGSSHITFQDNILKEEYEKWGLTYQGIDKRIIEKELDEYQQADAITVPSEFVRQSFLSLGVPENKVRKVIYGARLERFSRLQDPEKNKFTVLWVGAVTLRKGFIYLLRAFQQFSHPNKEFLVIGQVSKEVKLLLGHESLDHVRFLGQVANESLPSIYSSAHVFALSSIEEGLALVQGEAMACGCPIIATPNTGSEDMITDGREGFVIPIRSSEAIQVRLQRLADEPLLRDQMGENALEKVKSLGGWDQYGANYVRTIKSLLANQ
ncbi:glycosyltransferase family 4 protein [Parapedobacter tibetensis]|uniref:glycosyltransferase family 4 protein n=1 Tax=Parapedobacter tibetensis TaxID=2972951 RepID=UPI00214D87C7|nr:glycosyltransferase family 4 protein [Parapedobacter tibetensis]